MCLFMVKLTSAATCAECARSLYIKYNTATNTDGFYPANNEEKIYGFYAFLKGYLSTFTVHKAIPRNRDRWPFVNIQ